MTEERLKLHEKAETRINAIIDTLSQDKGGLADKLKQENVKDFLVSLWVDCSTEATKELEKENAELEDKLANADYQLEGRDNEIAKLEAQIKKMKCCTNCKYRIKEWGEFNPNSPNCKKCHNKSNWKLRR